MVTIELTSAEAEAVVDALIAARLVKAMGAGLDDADAHELRQAQIRVQEALATPSHRTPATA